MPKAVRCKNTISLYISSFSHARLTSFLSSFERCLPVCRKLIPRDLAPQRAFPRFLCSLYFDIYPRRVESKFIDAVMIEFADLGKRFLPKCISLFRGISKFENSPTRKKPRYRSLGKTAKSAAFRFRNRSKSGCLLVG
mgnify:CR=1 FL=1